MDPMHEQAVRRAASFAFHLAAIENALRVAEEMNEFRFLPETIRQQIAWAEEIAGDDLARSRKLLRGDYSR